MFKRIIYVMFGILIMAAAAGAVDNLPDGLYAEMETSRGLIVLALEFERTPLTVTNFVGLAEGKLGNRGTKPFYNGLIFHRVIKDFMIQGGDPEGTGRGGPGYTFADEIHPELKHDRSGTLSMANSGPATNGSQFFITHKPTPWLDGRHTVFGHVVRGQQVVDSIKEGDVIKEVRILRIGLKAKRFIVDQQAFDRLAGYAQRAAQERLEKEREKVLAIIKKRWPNAQSSGSGLKYVVLKKGSGPSPQYGSEVKVHYTGMFLDGAVFDSSVKRGKPALFKIGQVIPGWNEALMAMKKGEKRILIIPPDLAYGKAGNPGVIPPNSFLLFEVELLDF